MTKPLPPVLWLMGPTSAGKTTLASAFTEKLRRAGSMPVLHWDGDQVRDMIGDSLDFSSDSRLRVVRGLAVLAEATSNAGVLTVVSALTAHDNARGLIRALLPRLLIVYVHCPLETCMERDPKGIYEMAKTGKIDTLVGYNSQYVPPDNPDLEIDTSSADVDDCVDRLIEFVGGRGILPKGARHG